MKTKISHFPLFTLLFITLNVYAQRHEINVTNIDTPNQYNNDSFIITFDQPMQRIESDRIPISVKPTLKCYWTWIDHKNLSCNLNDYSNSDEDDYDYSKDKELQIATTYQVKFKKGLFDTNNNPLKAQTKRFTYKRPEFTNFKVLKWVSATKPVLELSFNQKIKNKSLKNKLFLLSDNGEKIKLNVTQDTILTKLKSKDYRYGDFYRVIVIPTKPLQNNTKYTVLIEKGIKSKQGKTKSLKAKTKETIHTPSDFSFLGYECDNPKVYGKNNQGPCYVGDTIVVNFSSFLTIDSVYQCQDTHIFTPKVYINYANNTSQLYLKPSSDTANYTNLNPLSDCLNKLADEFERKIKTNNSIKIQTKGFRPSLSLNLPRNTLITDKQKIELFTSSINLEKYYLHIDEINHKKIDKTFPVSVQNQQDTKVKTLLPLTVPEKNIQSISGYVSIEEKIEEKDKQSWNPKIIPFSIQKSPYQINFRHNANFASIQINDIDTAKPIKNSEFTLYQNDFPYKTKTDHKGFANIPLTKENKSSQFSIDIKHKKRMIHLFMFDNNSILIGKGKEYEGYFDIPDNSYEINGITDKPIYRPGEKLRFKFYIRQKKDTSYIIPPKNYTFKIYVDNSSVSCWKYENCHSFYVKEINQLDEFGGYTGEFILPKSSHNGQYSIEIFYNNENNEIYYSSNLTFQVSNFKNSDYKLSIESQKHYVKGREKVPVVATASYYSGGFVPDEKGEIAGEINKKDIRKVFPKYENYNFGEFEDDYTAFFLKDLNFDNKGEIHANYIPPKSDIEFGELKLNAGLKPKNGEWNYSSNLILPYRQKDYFLGLKLSSWVQQINKEITLESVLIDYKGVQHQVKNSTYKLSQYLEKNKWSKYKALKCQSKNSNSCVFKLKKAGKYKVSVQALYKDKNHTQEISFNVYNPFATDDKSKKPKIVIFSDKQKYEIGDTAHITLQFPFKHVSAFITAERNQILNSWVQTTSNGIIKLTMKITEKYAPGFDISALIQQPDKVNSYDYLRNINNNSLTIKVKEPKQKRLFSITTNKEVYLPKEQVKLTIKTNSDTSSNYVVAVIDQSIIDLIDTQYLYDLSELSYSQAKYYWELMDAEQLVVSDNSKLSIELNKESKEISGPNYNEFDDDKVELERVVTTGTHITRENLGAYPNEVKGRPEKPLPVFSIKRERKQAFIGNMSINKHDLRTLFADSAFFKTDVTIEAKGEQTITFKLPDNITQWKIIVLGTDTTGRLEFNQTAIKASKDLELRSTLPLQVTQGDSFSAEFAVVSKTNNKVTIQAAAEIKQNDLALNTLQTTFKKVEKLKSQTFSLPVEKINNGDLDVIALVKTDKNADGISQNIAVHPAQLELSTSQYGQFDGASKLLHFKQPKDLANNSGHLSLHVSNSLLPNLNPVYDYIHDYPHACWEQQSAKAIITAIEAVSDTKLTTQQIVEKKQFVQNILNVAQDFQASNGGMAFFKASNEHVNLFLSLYTLDNFEFLQKLGYNIPKNVYQQLKGFSKKILIKTNNLDNRIVRFEKDELSPEIQLMALLHTAGLDKKEAKEIKQSLFAKKEDLNLFALNNLLRIYQGESEKQQQILNIISDKFYSSDKKFTPKSSTSSAYSYWYLMPSQNKTQCDLIRSQLQLNENLINKNDLLKHINAVLERRNIDGNFGSTLENSYCAKALYEFTQKYERQNLSNDYHFAINKKEVKMDETILETRVNLSQDLEVEISNPVSGLHYYSASLKYPVKPESVKAQNHGFNLQRQYFIFNEGKWQQAKQFKTGDWVKTVLTIHSPIGRKFVAVSNPVPGGWLPTDTALARNMPVGIRESEKAFDNSYHFYERQLNPATTRFYADYLPAGSYNISYYSQIRNAGTFIAMPAIVEEMYDDENRATTTQTQIRILSE